MNNLLDNLIEAATTQVEHNSRGDGTVDTELVFNKTLFCKLILEQCIALCEEYDSPKMSGPGLAITQMIYERFYPLFEDDEDRMITKVITGYCACCGAPNYADLGQEHDPSCVWSD